MSVIAEMHAAATAYLAGQGYKYVPMRKRREVSAFDSGWPRVSGYPTETDRPAHGNLFADTAGTLHPLAYSDLPSIASLFEYIEGKPELLARVQPPISDGEQAEVAKSFYRYTVEHLPGSIYDRAMATGLTIDDPGVEALYRARERSWLMPELPYELVVPLLLVDLGISASFRIDADARFEPLTDDDLRAMAVDHDLSGVPTPVAQATKYALVVAMPPLKNTGEPLMTLFVRRDADPDPDLTKVRSICEALRIASSADVGWAHVYRRPLGWAHRWSDDLPAVSIAHSSREYPAVFDNYGWLKPGGQVDTNELAVLPELVAALATAAKKARLAARRLSMAEIRDDPDDQLVDACIGLEALLGQENAELSYRVAVRAAALLSSRKDQQLNAAVVFNLTRKVYNRRSELVHGSVSNKHDSFTFPNGSKMPTNDLAVFLLRQVLLDRLLRNDNWTVEDLDTLLLRSLEQQPAGAETSSSDSHERPTGESPGPAPG